MYIHLLIFVKQFIDFLSFFLGLNYHYLSLNLLIITVI
ncbi:hypothetical protein CWATWH0402_3235 [Crocosphaera watsonii WH 0402]|uniref:Uncharacterized protein n=1 Tax=Crocosphaera watsonii WH 0402 TaxID=1284629 RepID=T2JMT5_CROWT|nr:hypothetical protein CWATWH0402_3235 [Crocosphaera watsonii WH 0402]